MLKLNQKQLKSLSTSDLLDRYEFAVGRVCGAGLLMQNTECGSDSREGKLLGEYEAEAVKIRQEVARRLVLKGDQS